MVRKEDRGEGKFMTLTKALELATYTIKITDNKKIFIPEHYKTTERLVYMARDIYHRTRVANDIRVKCKEDLLMRRKYQNEAIEQCDLLLSEIQIAKMLFHLRTKRIRHWGSMIEEVKGYLRSWRDSDLRRYKNHEINL